MGIYVANQVAAVKPDTSDRILSVSELTPAQYNAAMVDESGVAFAKTATEVNQLQHAGAVAANGDTLTVTAALHAGKVIQFGKTDGTECTLPAATGTGHTYRFVIGVAATSSANLIEVANATDVMNGSLCIQQDTDEDGAVKVWRADAGDDTMSFAGAAGTGGIVGGYIQCTDYKAGFWSCQAFIQSGGGSEVTPFSAGVS